MKRHLKGFGWFLLVVIAGGVGLDLFLALIGFPGSTNFANFVALVVGIYVWYWTVKEAKKKKTMVPNDKIDAKDIKF